MVTRFENKSKAKLLAAIAVLAVVFAVFTAIPMASNDSDATNSEATVNGYKVSFANTLEASVSGNTISFEGYVSADAATLEEGEEGSKKSVFGNDALLYGYVSLTGLDGSMGIIQTNTALSAVYPDLFKDNVKTKLDYTFDKDSATGGASYSFLVPKDGSDVTLKFTTGNKSSAVTNTIILDFSKVSTQITLGDVNAGALVDGKGWTYTCNNNVGTLTLANYKGSDIFSTEKNLVVELTGTNTMDVYGHEASRAIYSKGTMNINATADDAKLTIKQNTASAYGIYADGAMTIGDNVKKVILDISGGNRAIFAPTNLTVQKADVTAEASEKAIRVNATYTMTVDKGSNVTASLSGSGYVNGVGTDDLFAIKTGKLTVSDAASVVTTQGLCIEATDGAYSNAGKIIVSGDYKQNAGAVKTGGLMALVAGLYYQGSAEIAATTEAATVGKVFLTDNAGTYGNIVVDSKKEVTASTYSVGLFTNANKVTVTGNTVDTPTIPAGKTLVIAPGVTLTGNITLGKGSSVSMYMGGSTTTINMEAGAITKTVTLTGVSGNVSISFGSAEINGVVSGGTITTTETDVIIGNNGGLIVSGDTTIEVPDNAKVRVENLTINTGATLTINRTSGAATVNMYDDSAVTINGKLAVGDGITAYADGRIGGNGTILVKTGASFVMNSGSSTTATFDSASSGTITTEEALENLNISGNLSQAISVYGATQKVTVNGNLTINSGESLTIMGELVVVEGKKITINNGGRLIITGPAATAEIYGNIVSMGANGFSFDGKDLNIYGSITANKTNDGDVSVIITGNADLEGTLTVINGAKAQFGKLNIAEAGTVTINGTFIGTMYNAGTVQINGTVEAAGGSNATVYMTGNNAKVVIDALKNGSLTVTDLGMYLRTDTSGDPEKQYVGANGVVKSDGNLISGTQWGIGSNSVTFSNVTGVTVTENRVYETVLNSDMSVNAAFDSKMPYNRLCVEGTVGPQNSAKNLDDSYASMITVDSGRVDVTGNMVLGQTKVFINGELYVSGNVTAPEAGYGISGIATGKLTVTGLVKTFDEATTVKITAVHYVQKDGDKRYNFYTNLAAAIASGEKILTVHGDLYILENTAIPDGIDVDASGRNVYIGNGDSIEVTLTVEDGGYFAAGTSYVYGTLYVENTDDGIDCSTIISDTQYVDEDESTAMYTNIYAALAAAGVGDTVKVTKIRTGNVDPVVFIGKDTTIPEGVTLLLPGGKTIAIKNGVTLTVEGKIDSRGTIDSYKTVSTYPATKGTFDKTEDSYASITLGSAGTIMSTTQMAYTTYNIAGAYYIMGTIYYISSVSVAADNANSAEGKTVTIYGSVSVDKVSFVGTEDLPIDLRVDGGSDIKAADFKISFATLKVATGVKLSGTFGSAEGSVTFDNVAVGTAIDGAYAFVLTQKSVDSGDLKTPTLFVAGNFIKNDLKKTSDITFEGIVKISHLDVCFVNTSTATITGTVVIASDATVSFAASSTSAGTQNDMKSRLTDLTFKVEGTFTVSNNAELNTLGYTDSQTTPSTEHLAATIIVNGTFTVAEKIGSLKEGIAKISTIWIGGESKNIAYNNNRYDNTTGAAAAVNGLLDSDELVLVYLFPGATITEGNVANFYSTEFYCDGVMLVKVFAKNSNVVVGGYSAATDEQPAHYSGTVIYPTSLIGNNLFGGWMYIDDNGQYKYTSNRTPFGNNYAGTSIVGIAFGNSPEYMTSVTIGQYSKVYADVITEAYIVTLEVDAGVDNVYIDDVLVASEGISSGSIYVNVSAGAHTVRVTLGNGYTGVVDMSFDGKKITDGKFTISASDYALKNFTLVVTDIVASGFDVIDDTPKNDDSGMSVTDYLLIVLVVLIVVMAIIVAMRMLRA